MMPLKIAGASLNQTPIDWENNTANIIMAIEEARNQRVEILCLPELCLTGYSCEDLFLSDWLSKTAWEKLSFILKFCQGMIVCVGLPIRIDKHTYNGICVVKNGTILGITLKQNLAKEGVHYEPRWFEPWPSGKVIQHEYYGQTVQFGDLIYESHGIRFGFEICEDAWSAVRPGKRFQQHKVNLIFNPSASHFALGKSAYREKIVVVDGSRDFNCTYVFVNQLGNEAGRMIYDGDVIFGQNGKIIASNRRLSFLNYSLLACNIDFVNPSNSENKIESIEISRNEEFVQAASLALFDYLRKSKAKGFVLSLSGGADSACCAVLVYEMIKRASGELGWNLFWKALDRPNPELMPKTVKEATNHLFACAYQSTQNSSITTTEIAKQLAESIGSQFYEWSVEAEVSSYKSKIESILRRTLTWSEDDISLQNIQARSRSPIVWLLANVNNFILLTTSNRSEGSVGYTTMDGDTSGSLALLVGVDKAFIQQWLLWATTNLNHGSLKVLNSIAPTAELRPPAQNQTDEVDLMPYSVLAKIERMAIFNRKSPKEIFDTMFKDYEPSMIKAWIKKFFHLWASNQWKRERLAPSFHFDDYNIDPRSGCRFPILSGGFKSELKELDDL